MTSITNIPIDDIELFLEGNGISVPSNKEKMYDIAKKLLYSDKIEFIPDTIINFIIADNLIQTKADRDIEKYTRSQIKQLPNYSINKLSRLLGLDEVDIDRIIDILFYMGKIEEDMPELNIDIFSQILKHSDIYDIENFCRTGNKICETKILKNLLTSRLSKDDNLDVSRYSSNELIRYNKIAPLKKKMGTFYDSTDFNYILYYINSDGISIHVNDIDYDFGEPINQVVRQSYNFIIVLTAEGNLLSYNIKSNTIDEFLQLDKICAISNGIGGLNILTASGNFYTWGNNELDKITEPEGIIYMTDPAVTFKIMGKFYVILAGEYYHRLNNKLIKVKPPRGVSSGIIERFYLTDEGKIYYLFDDQILKMKNLSKIKQISNYFDIVAEGKMLKYYFYVLTIDGKICAIDMENYELKFSSRNDIVKIANSGYITIILDSKGDIFSVKFVKQNFEFKFIRSRCKDVIYDGKILILTFDNKHEILTIKQ